MRPTLLLLIAAAFVVSACGADAPPEPRTKPQSGFSVSGDARIGVTARL